MTDHFASLIDPLIGREGGYVFDPRDPGGETNWGVTVGVARKYGYRGPMRDLPRATAVEIYRKRYWIDPGFDRVADLSVAIADELFDTGVNMGPSVPARWLQECLNALNNQGKLYADIGEDADVGPATLTSLKSYLKARGAEGVSVMLKALNCLQGARYIEIARGRSASEAFLYGWLRTRV